MDADVVRQWQTGSGCEEPVPGDPTVTPVTASDNCDNDVTIVFTPGVLVPAVDCPNGGTITHTWTATDDCGNETVRTLIINVQDTTAPTFTAPADITIQCDQDVDDLSTLGDVTNETDGCTATSSVTITIATGIDTDGDGVIDVCDNDDDNDERPMSTEKLHMKKTKTSTKEQAQIIRARAYLKRLDNKIQEKDEIVKQIRYIFFYYSKRITDIHSFIHSFIHI